MSHEAGAIPFETHQTSGIVHRRSHLSVTETVERLTGAVVAEGAKLFAVVDHSGEAKRAGFSLRDTKLLIFGNPAAGTPVMLAAPLAALDLPLKVLVWADGAGVVWMTYLSAEWQADRYGIPADLVKPLAAVDALTGRIADSS